MQKLKDELIALKTDVKEILLLSRDNAKVLEYHIKRTDLNEERIVYMERWLLGILAAILIAVCLKFFVA